MPLITELFAFVATEAEGDEGIMATSMDLPKGGQMMMPLIGADLDRVDSLRKHADDIAEQTGIPYRVIRFKMEEDIT